MSTPVHSNHKVQELQLRRKPKLQMSPLMKSCVQLDGRPQGALTVSTISQSVPLLLLLQCFRLIRTRTRAFASLPCCYCLVISYNVDQFLQLRGFFRVIALQPCCFYYSVCSYSIICKRFLFFIFVGYSLCYC